ncbi:MAG: hypothetical protein GWO41_04130 [candidate division Zixibacteria bacterium]|nr:hypothetical protein [candidate division Zixibacteria bacterium]NIR64086.1 hypothetical protein [candidate division Zixibacteria bacterium]NIS15415.1 hypothetical protein [candidate division Zixibacteria bacterium]NIS45984.1 hypothetical protein [candidate division Zixibacteria bacterium]NIT51943.1 hypothetical protein [candidate division Zixibacteria bacterium]
MILKIAILVFAAVFFITFGLFLFLKNRMSSESRRMKMRLNGIAAGGEIQDEFLHSLIKDNKLSNIPLLHNFLMKLRFSRNLQILITQAGVSVNLGTLVLSMFSLGALFMLLGYHLLHDMLISVAMGIAGIAIPYLFLVMKKRKRLEEFEGQLPEALDMIVNALKAGFSFDSSLRMVVQEIPDPLGLEMAITYEEQNLGIELSEALNNLKMRVPSDDLEIFLTALLIHKKTGGNLAEVLNKTAKTIRDRLRLKREVKTKTVHGRFSGMVLILLPIIMAIAIYLLNPDYVMVLIKEKIGNYLLIAAILMQIIGIFVIRKIVNIRL